MSFTIGCWCHSPLRRLHGKTDWSVKGRVRILRSAAAVPAAMRGDYGALGGAPSSAPSSVMSNHRLYRVLQLRNTGASQEDIKRAYRKMAARTHPDRNQGDPDATVRCRPSTPCPCHLYALCIVPLPMLRIHDALAARCLVRSPSSKRCSTRIASCPMRRCAACTTATASRASSALRSPLPPPPRCIPPRADCVFADL